MIEANVKISRKVFNEAYLPYLEEMARTQIFYGGASSGKSVFLAQRSVYDLLQGGRNYLICRQVGRTLRGSVFTEVCKVISNWGLSEVFSINKSDMLVTCKNGYQIIFGGLDDVEKLKSLTPAKGVITDVWVEEATETDKATVRQLVKRQRGGKEETPKRLTLSFNPVYKTHWIYKDYFELIGWTDTQHEYRGDGITILKTTYKDNRFLTQADRDDLEREDDEYYFQVYTLGNWGVLGHVIFTNWHVADLDNPDDPYYLPEAQRTNRRHGLDFGYADDPAAMPCMHYDRKKKLVYFYDELYERGLTNPELAKQIAPKIGKDRLTCDSAEPKSIRELRDNGVNAVGAKKGKDSVLFGIQWLQQQTLIVDRRCINTQNEFSIYHWKEDAGGNALPVPVDKDNHLIDGSRYGLEDDMVPAHAEVVKDPYANW
jgi:phage terminase large subunit